MVILTALYPRALENPNLTMVEIAQNHQVFYVNHGLNLVTFLRHQGLRQSFRFHVGCLLELAPQCWTGVGVGWLMLRPPSHWWPNDPPRRSSQASRRGAAHGWNHPNRPVKSRSRGHAELTLGPRSGGQEVVPHKLKDKVICKTLEVVLQQDTCIPYQKWYSITLEYTVNDRVYCI